VFSGFPKNKVVLDLGVVKFNLLNFWHVLFKVSVVFLVAIVLGIIKV